MRIQTIPFLLAEENGEFSSNGLMRLRLPTIKDLPIRTEDRPFPWDQGRRPDDPPGLTGPGFSETSAERAGEFPLMIQ